jgi:lysophospholipase L1-like esterase
MPDRKIVVATVGDSISAGNPGWDPNPELWEREGDNPESQYQYWAALKDPRLDFRNHGVGGEVVSEIAARLEEGVAGADVLVVQGGINDVFHGLPIEGAADGLRGMVARGQELGLGVVITDVLPWNRGWPDAEPKIRALNELIAGIAADAGIDVLPFHDTLEDPEQPGRMKAEWTPDGNHPSVAGHRRLGELAFHLPTGWEPRA